jgi:DNA-binding transcriptional LysR family regulator
LPELLLSFRQSYPEVTFSVLVRDTKQVIKSIKDYTYNIGFIGEAVKDEDIEASQVNGGRIDPHNSPRHMPLPRGEGDLPAGSGVIPVPVKLPFILREPGSATRLAFEKAIKKRLAGRKAASDCLHGKPGSHQRRGAERAWGPPSYPSTPSGGAASGGPVEGYRLKDLPMQRSFYLILRKKRALPPLAQVFLDFTQGSNYFPNKQRKTKDPYDKKSYFTFPSIHFAIRAEKILGRQLLFL